MQTSKCYEDKHIKTKQIGIQFWVYIQNSAWKREKSYLHSLLTQTIFCAVSSLS